MIKHEILKLLERYLNNRQPFKFIISNKQYLVKNPIKAIKKIEKRSHSKAPLF